MTSINRQKFENILDRIVQRGGSWEKMEYAADLNRRMLKLRKTKRDSPSLIMGHLSYRQSHDKFFNKNLIIDESGIINRDEKECINCGSRFLRNNIFPLEKNLESFFTKNKEEFDDRLCNICLEEIVIDSSKDELFRANDDFWEENNPWPGLEPCDWLGG